MRVPSIPSLILFTGAAVFLTACANEPAAMEPELEATELQVRLARTGALTSLGETVELEVVARDAAGTDLGSAVQFSTSDEGVATVRSPGIVTATGNGEATLTARVGSLSAAVTVSIVQRVASMAFGESAEVQLLGQTATLATVLMLDSLGSVATNDEGTEIEYEISDLREPLQIGSAVTVAGIATVTDQLFGLPGTRSIRARPSGGDLAEVGGPPFRALLDGFLIDAPGGVRAYDRAQAFATGDQYRGIQADDLALSFDERTAITAELPRRTNNVTFLDLAEGRAPTTVTVPGNPSSVVAHPSQQIAYVAAIGAGVTAFDLVSKTEVAQVSVAEVGDRPSGMNITADGTSLLVVDQARGVLNLVSTSSMRVESQIPVGLNPFQVAVSPDGTKAYVGLTIAKEIVVITLADGRVESRITVDGRPRHLEVVQEGNGLVVAFLDFGGSLSLIDTRSNTVTTTRSIESPADLASSVQGDELYVLTSNRVETLDPETLQSAERPLEALGEAAAFARVNGGGS